MISDPPNGLKVNAMIAAVAREIVNLSYMRSAYFSEKLSREVMVKSTNDFSSTPGKQFTTGKQLRDQGKGK